MARSKAQRPMAEAGSVGVKGRCVRSLVDLELDLAHEGRLDLALGKPAVEGG